MARNMVSRLPALLCISIKLDRTDMVIHTHRYIKGNRPDVHPEYMSIKRPWQKANRAAIFSL